MLGYCAQYLDKSKIKMIFEPGTNAAIGNQWEGMAVDHQVVDWVQSNGYGGVGCWTMNDSDHEKANNCITLMNYSNKGYSPML